MSEPLVVLGDTLLDVDLYGAVQRECPDAPGAPVLDVDGQSARPGGAGLAALLAAADGAPVRLVTALADDADAELLRHLLGDRVELVAGPWLGSTPVKCRLLAGERSVARIDRGSGGCAASTGPMRDALSGASAVLVSDYGRGMAADPALRAALAREACEVPVIWDPHPRGPDPVRGAALATPNLDEAARAARRPGESGRSASERSPEMVAAWAARRLRHRWAAEALAVTLGSHGTLLDQRGRRARVLPAPQVTSSDPCGAGDRFAAAAAVALCDGCDQGQAVASALAAAAGFLADGGAGRIGEHRPELNYEAAGERRRA